MRSMFISLILFCSLTKFAIADTTPEPKTKGCGTVYYCYVPEICTDVNMASKPLSEYGVKEVKEESHVNDDCPAILRYHLYTVTWINVTLESFQPKESIESIEFMRKGELSGIPFGIIETVSCSIKKDNQQIETLFGKFKLKNGEKTRESPPPSKLKCNFVVKNSGRKPPEIFAGAFNEQLSFSITTVTPNPPDTVPLKVSSETKEDDDTKLNTNPKCDPSLFKFKKESNITQLHKLVDFEPGKYYCADPRYKMQFKSSATASYEPVEKIDCKRSTFHVNDIKMADKNEKKLPIEIRCVADSKFFCKYNAKPFVSQDPHKKAVIGPDMDTAKESEMKCPPGMPNLIVVRESRMQPVMNATFECHHVGYEEQWKVGELPITKEGPEIHCTDNVKCHDIENNGIPESSVVNGYLRTTDFTPACLNDGTSNGTLFVEDKGVPREQVMSTRCDGLTGEFKYAIKSGEFVIGKETKFECTYPVYTDTAKDEKNEQTLRTGSITAACVALVLAAGIFGIAFFVARKKKIQERKKMAKMNNDAYSYYCADAIEGKQGNVGKRGGGKGKEANKGKVKPKKKEAALDKGTGESMKWTDMILSFYSAAKNKKVEVADGSLVRIEGKAQRRKKMCIKKESNAENVKKSMEIEKNKTEKPVTNAVLAGFRVKEETDLNWKEFLSRNPEPKKDQSKSKSEKKQ